MKLPGATVASGTIVLAIGAAGLIRGVVPQSADASSAPLVVSGAYVRPPVPPTELAAAYFTVTNTTGTDDTLIGITTSAGAEATLHQVDADGVMTAAADGAVVPAHGRLVLSVGQAHVMIVELTGRLESGEKVPIDLRFQHSPRIEVMAKVIPFGQPTTSVLGGSQ